MSLAALSVAALVIALVVSTVSQINIGVLAIVMAWIVGVYLGGMKAEQVLAGFPVSLFLTLVGVTLLFAAGAGQWNARTAGAARGAALPGRARPDSNPVLPSDGRAVVERAGKHRGDRLDGTTRNGRGGTLRHSAVPHGDHDRQRRQRRIGLPHRSDRRHRQPAGREDRTARCAMDDLREQLHRPRGGRVRGLFPARRLEAAAPAGTMALPSRRIGARPTSRGRRDRRAPIPPKPLSRRHWLTLDCHWRADRQRHRLQRERRHGGARRRARPHADPGRKRRRARSRRCRGTSS